MVRVKAEKTDYHCKKCGERYDKEFYAFLCSLKRNPRELKQGDIIEGHESFGARRIYIISAGGEIERGFWDLSHNRKYSCLSCFMDDEGAASHLSFHSHLSVDIQNSVWSGGELPNREFVVDTPYEVILWAKLFRSLIRDSNTYSEREQEIIQNTNNSLTRALCFFKKIRESL